MDYDAGLAGRGAALLAIADADSYHVGVRPQLLASGRDAPAHREEFVVAWWQALTAWHWRLRHRSVPSRVRCLRYREPHPSARDRRRGEGPRLVRRCRGWAVLPA